MAEPRLGLIMILLNEAANLARSLAPVAACFDEVVVVDTGSSDQTVQLCKELGARVYYFTWQDDFAAARNESIARARADWLFWLDGDNSLDPDQVAELRAAIPAQGPAVLWALEQVVPSGERLWQKRGFPRLPGVRFEGRVHEQLIHPASWPSRITPVVIKHWGYQDPQKVAAKGRYYLGLLKQTLEENDREFYAHFQIARCYLNLRQLDKAERHLACLARSEQARQCNQDLWLHGQVLWSQVLSHLGKDARAAQVLDRLLEECPNAGLVHYQRGRLAYQRRDWARAVVHLKQALRLGLGTPLVDLDIQRTLFLTHFFLGRARENLGQAWAAAASFSEAVKLQPENPALRCDLARVLLSVKDTTGARRQLERALSLKPGYRQARRLLEHTEACA